MLPMAQSVLAMCLLGRIGEFWVCARNVENTGGPERIRTHDFCLRRAALYGLMVMDGSGSMSLTSHILRLLDRKYRTVYVVHASYLDLCDRVPMWAVLDSVEITDLAQHMRTSSGPGAGPMPSAGRPASWGSSSSRRSPTRAGRPGRPTGGRRRPGAAHQPWPSAGRGEGLTPNNPRSVRNFTSPSGVLDVSVRDGSRRHLWQVVDLGDAPQASGRHCRIVRHRSLCRRQGC